MSEAKRLAKSILGLTYHKFINCRHVYRLCPTFIPPPPKLKFRSFNYLLTTGEDKLLTLWQIESFKLLNSRELPKRPGLPRTPRLSWYATSMEMFSVPLIYYNNPIFYGPFLPSEVALKDKGKDQGRDAILSRRRLYLVGAINGPKSMIIPGSIDDT
ncbi:hypothetical protein CPB83DRAFT_553560 [Crepidotus variabilis]|uniref:Uncharacterized protein n=1 Tax=Crepidotus variabilis TaxID=179855 RepID=A0A9P6JM37_9AGAR|nr:hypothetical protein CPB83DRAFT_553560 [Crepidotus variabilis]